MPLSFHSLTNNNVNWLFFCCGCLSPSLLNKQFIINEIKPEPHCSFACNDQGTGCAQVEVLPGRTQPMLIPVSNYVCMLSFMSSARVESYLC